LEQSLRSVFFEVSSQRWQQKRIFMPLPSVCVILIGLGYLQQDCKTIVF
jgi:hypothetical protein